MSWSASTQRSACSPTCRTTADPGRWPGTRELIIPGTPYIVPYRVQGNRVEILRILHGARRWPAEPME